MLKRLMADGRYRGPVFVSVEDDQQWFFGRSLQDATDKAVSYFDSYDPIYDDEIEVNIYTTNHYCDNPGEEEIPSLLETFTGNELVVFYLEMWGPILNYTATGLFPGSVYADYTRVDLMAKELKDWYEKVSKSFKGMPHWSTSLFTAGEKIEGEHVLKGEQHISYTYEIFGIKQEKDSLTDKNRMLK